jgi:hypothetical protein
LNSEAEYTELTGRSPTSRWLAKAFDYSDLVSTDAGTAALVKVNVPEGSIVTDCMVRLDEVFDGTGANAIDVGDSNVADGWAVNLDLTTSVASVPVIFRDANAVYTNKASDCSAGSTGAQLYMTGGVITIGNWTTPPTQGQGIIFLHIISYHEAQGAEWS